MTFGYRVKQKFGCLGLSAVPVLKISEAQGSLVSGCQHHQSSRSLSSLSGSRTFFGLPSKLRSHSHLRAISSLNSPLSISTTYWPMIGRNFQPFRINEQHSGHPLQLVRLTWKEPRQIMLADSHRSMGNGTYRLLLCIVADSEGADIYTNCYPE